MMAPAVSIVLLVSPNSLRTARNPETSTIQISDTGMSTRQPNAMNWS